MWELTHSNQLRAEMNKCVWESVRYACGMRTRASESTIAAERINWRSLCSPLSVSLSQHFPCFTLTYTHTKRSANVPASREAEILLPILWSIVSYVCMNNTHTDSGDDVWCAFWSQWICMHLFALFGSLSLIFGVFS